MSDLILFWVSDHNTPAIRILKTVLPKKGDAFLLLVSNNPRMLSASLLLKIYLEKNYPQNTCFLSNELNPRTEFELRGTGGEKDQHNLKKIFSKTQFLFSNYRFIATGGTKIANLMVQNSLDSKTHTIEYVPDGSHSYLSWNKKNNQWTEKNGLLEISLNNHFSLYGTGKTKSGDYINSESEKNGLKKRITYFEEWEKVNLTYIKSYLAEKYKKDEHEKATYKKAKNIPTDFFKTLIKNSEHKELFNKITEYAKSKKLMKGDYKTENFPLEGFWLEYLWAFRLFEKYDFEIGLSNAMKDTNNDIDLAYMLRGSLNVGEVKSGFKKNAKSDITEWCYKLDSISEKVGRCNLALYFKKSMRDKVSSLKVWKDSHLRLASSKVNFYFEKKDLQDNYTSPWHWSEYFEGSKMVCSIHDEKYFLKAFYQNKKIHFFHFQGDSKHLILTNQTLDQKCDLKESSINLTPQFNNRFELEISSFKLYSFNNEESLTFISKNKKNELAFRKWS